MANLEELLKALEKVCEHHRIILAKAGAAGHRFSEKEQAWVSDPWTQAFADAKALLRAAKRRNPSEEELRAALGAVCGDHRIKLLEELERIRWNNRPFRRGTEVQEAPGPWMLALKDAEKLIRAGQ